MQTSRPVSTISYNTPEYLRQRLEELRKAHKVSEWYYIQHEPEDDEGGNKRHIHLYLVPSQRLQTDDLREYMQEIDLTHPGKPLGCPVWRISKWADWYMYAIHDAPYLASKGQTRRYHYRMEDVTAWDETALAQQVREIDLTSLTRLQAMQDAITHGLSFVQFARSGGVPIQQVHQYEEMWRLLTIGDTLRRGSGAHEPPPTIPQDAQSGQPEVIDRATGETAIYEQVKAEDELPF